MEDKPKILIVEDDPSNARLIQRCLEDDNRFIEIASSGWEGIEKCRESVYALIIMDIIMPEINGFETLLRIKSLTSNRETPVFFITGMETTSKQLVEAYKVGAIDFIKKPINLKVLKRKAKFFVDFYIQNQKVQYSKIQMEKLMKSRMNLTANITHELRTPLFAMLGMLEELTKKNQDKELKDIITKIHNNSEYLLDTVNDFLDFSKIELSETKINNEFFSLKNVLVDILDLIRYQKKNKDKVKLKLHVDKTLPEFIRADKGKIRHVLINLLSNSMKFTDEGEILLSADNIGFKKDRPVLKLSVKDTGIGIPKAKLATIFDEYSQVHNAKQAEVQGTGLGLNICKKMVDVLGGDLKAQSTEGEGANFYFKIPYEVGEASDYSEVKQQYSFDQLLGDNKLKVLIVDDVKDNIFVIKSYINVTNLEIDECSDAEDALSMMINNHYDIVLLDISMPKMNGDEVCLKYRQFELNNKLQDKVIIALTAYSYSDELEQRLLLAGFNNYLMKPLKKQDLYEMIMKYVHDESFEKVSKNQIEVLENEQPDISFDELDEEFMEYIPVFISNKITEINSLIEHLKNEDSESASKVCHKILGTAKSFGFNKLDKLIEHIHSTVRKDSAVNFEDLLEIANQSKSHLEEVKLNKS